MKIADTLTVVFSFDIPLKDIAGHENKTPEQIAMSAYKEALWHIEGDRKNLPACVVMRQSNLVGPFEILNSGTPGEDFVEIK